MGRSENHSKVYLEALEKIKKIVFDQNLQAGDRLPSERELAEQLNIGRSSVREALRAMEILGLIETKRGEGTFIADFRNHNLVELLSSFILQRKEAKADLRDTKKNIELAIILQMIDQKKSWICLNGIANLILVDTIF